jgi:hypothetical protein
LAAARSGALLNATTSTAPERAMAGGADDTQSRSNSTIPEDSESSHARTSRGAEVGIVGVKL